MQPPDQQEASVGSIRCHMKIAFMIADPRNNWRQEGPSLAVQPLGLHIWRQNSTGRISSTLLSIEASGPNCSWLDHALTLNEVNMRKSLNKVLNALPAERSSPTRDLLQAPQAAFTGTLHSPGQSSQCGWNHSEMGDSIPINWKFLSKDNVLAGHTFNLEETDSLP